MIDLHKQGKISMEKVIEKMCHAPADMFDIDKRGYLREGYYADVVVVNPNDHWTVGAENIMAKCGWSPFEGHTFGSKVEHTFVSGHHAWNHGELNDSKPGMRLLFNR